MYIGSPCTTICLVNLPTMNTSSHLQNSHSEPAPEVMDGHALPPPPPTLSFTCVSPSHAAIYAIESRNPRSAPKQPPEKLPSLQLSWKTLPEAENFMRTEERNKVFNFVLKESPSPRENSDWSSKKVYVCSRGPSASGKTQIPNLVVFQHIRPFSQKIIKPTLIFPMWSYDSLNLFNFYHDSGTISDFCISVFGLSSNLTT
jgi:hypothetical protein